MVSVATVTFILLFALYSDFTIPAVASSLQQFFVAVLPSLFPFYVAVAVLRKTKFCNILSGFSENIMRPLFGVSGAGAFAMITGAICGYPAGASISAELYHDGKITKEDVIRLSSFVNNTGPLFIIGTVGAKMLGSVKAGLALWVCHITASFLSGIIVCNVRRFFLKNGAGVHLADISDIKEAVRAETQGFGKIFSDAMTSSMFTMLPISAAIVFFAALSAVCEASGLYGFISESFEKLINPALTKGILMGFLEITGGISQISSLGIGEKLTAVIISSLAGFAGISVHFQVAGIYADVKIPFKTFFFGKCIHALTAGLLSFVFIWIFR